MKSGLLTGTMTRERVAAFPEDDFRQRALHFREPLLTRNLKIAGKVKEIAARHGRSAGEAAIAWTLRRPEVTAAIVGMRSPKQVEGIIGAADFRLSDSEVAELESFIAGL
jgi:aryl-alcohol dehydrogenase-like predicted oxidoreductase